jgi:hypothetical protein
MMIIRSLSAQADDIIVLAPPPADYVGFIDIRRLTAGGIGSADGGSAAVE